MKRKSRARAEPCPYLTKALGALLKADPPKKSGPPPRDSRAWAEDMAALLDGKAVKDGDGSEGWVCVVRRGSDGGIVALGAFGIRTYAGPVTFGLGSHDCHILLD